jgi:hypothetical protein
MTRLRKRSAFRPRVIQPPSRDDTRGPTPERMRHAQGFVEWGNLGRGRTGVVTLRDSPIDAGDLPQVRFVNAAVEALTGVASTCVLLLFVREDREAE